MPALPDVPQVIKARLHYDVGTDAQAVNIVHLKYSGAAPSPADMNTYCTSFNALTAAEWPIYQDSETTYLGIDVVDLTTPTSSAGAAGTSVVGTRAGSLLSASACVLIDYPIGRRYRGGKPRTYLPWGTSNDLDTRQTWSSPATFHTGWSAIVNAFLAAGPIGSAVVLGLVSVSYYGPPNRTITGSTGRVRTVSTVRAAPIVDALSTFNVSAKVASQRRRNLQRA